MARPLCRGLKSPVRLGQPTYALIDERFVHHAGIAQARESVRWTIMPVRCKILTVVMCPVCR